MGNRNNTYRSSGPATIELYESIRKGDQYAFARYYESSLDRLVTLVSRIIKDEEEAKNIAQDTFIKLWQHRDHIDPSQSLDGFVSRLAWNAALNYLRRKQTHARYHLEQLHTQSLDSISADEDLVATETARRIEAVIANMPPQRRRVFEMSRIENLTYNQIADKLGLTYNTVMNHMKLALQEIRTALSLILLFSILK